MKLWGTLVIVVAMIWIAAYALFHLAMTSIAESYYEWSLMTGLLWLGPLLFLVGGLLTIIGWQCRIATVLISVGALILTIFLGYALSGLFNRQPLEAKPPYLFLTIFAIVTSITDIAAVRLFQLAWFSATVKPVA
jgi:hypothetical protein